MNPVIGQQKQNGIESHRRQKPRNEAVTRESLVAR
jgi:hypothetical protein